MLQVGEDTLLHCRAAFLCTKWCSWARLKVLGPCSQEPSRGTGNSRRSRTTAPTVGWSVVTAEARQTEQPISQYAGLAKYAVPSSDTSAFPQLSRTHEVQEIGRPTSATESNTWQKKASAINGVPWKAESTGHREWLRNESHGRASVSSTLEGTMGQLSETHPWADEALLKVAIITCPVFVSELCSWKNEAKGAISMCPTESFGGFIGCVGSSGGRHGICSLDLVRAARAQYKSQHTQR